MGRGADRLTDGHTETKSTEGEGVRGREEQRKGGESDRQMDRQTFMCTHTHTSHIKLSTVYMYPHISWRHSEKRADSNQTRAYKAKSMSIKLIRETALAWGKTNFSFSTSCVASKLAAKTGTVTATLHFLSRAVTRSPRPSCTLPVDTGSLTHCCLRFHQLLPHNKKNNAF